MEKKKKRKKHFSFKELRLSIAHMVLWALLSVAFFTYLTIEFSEQLKRIPLYFLIVIAGYAIIVVVLTLVFTHRFLGPFERLKTELKIILSGKPHHRLRIRNRDDFYIKSFIMEVNKLLDKFEKKHLSGKELHEKLDSKLLHIKFLTEKKEISKEELKEAIISFHDEVENLLKEGGK